MKKFVVALIGGLVLICSVYLIYTFTIAGTHDENNIDKMSDVSSDEILGEIDINLLDENGGIQIGEMV